MAEEISEAPFSCRCLSSLTRRRQRYGSRLKRREWGMIMVRRRLSAIDECQHTTKDPESHTCAVFQMEPVSVELSIDQDRAEFFKSELHAARFNLFPSDDDLC